MIVYGKDRDYIVHDDTNIKGMFGDYRWLSNFHICPIYFEGSLYHSTEAAYMSGKSTDLEVRKQFIDITPSSARKLGQTISLRDGWDDIKYDVMAAVVFDKYYRNLDLRKLLLETGDKYIEETNHWSDIYWGVCDGVGQNNLGIITMNIRKFWRNKPCVGFVL